MSTSRHALRMRVIEIPSCAYPEVRNEKKDLGKNPAGWRKFFHRPDQPDDLWSVQLEITKLKTRYLESANHPRDNFVHQLNLSLVEGSTRNDENSISVVRCMTYFIVRVFQTYFASGTTSCRISFVARNY